MERVFLREGYKEVGHGKGVEDKGMGAGRCART